MRALLPDLADDPDLHEFYARDWVAGGGVRVNMISSVDGAATAGGLSQGLQTRGDNRVFAALRDLADVVLVGAATAAAENYRPNTPKPERTVIRQRFGLAAALPIALTSRSLRIDTTCPLFADPGNRPLVYTCESADAGRRLELEEVADVVVCGAEAVDLPGVRSDLAARGLGRILCEGGPTLLAAMLAADAVDELCLSISPLLVGPGAIRIVTGAAWPAQRHELTLASLLEEDGALFARYRR